MEESTVFMKKFFELYLGVKQNYGLLLKTHFDIYGNNNITILDDTDHVVIKVKEDSEECCYSEAIDLLNLYIEKRCMECRV